MSTRAKLIWLCLLCVGLCVVAHGQELTPWYDNPAYQRDEPTPAWWILNNGQPSNLYLNGVWQSSESGTNDLRMLDCQNLQPRGASIGIITLSSSMARAVSIAQQASPNSAIFQNPTPRWDVPYFSAGISNCVNAGCRVVTMDMGWGAPDDGLSNACLYALSSNVIICASTPDSPGDLDTAAVDYPYAWHFPNVLGISASDRNGQPYWSGSGLGSIGAPGRNIVGAGTYGSGTSQSAPLAAGCLALVMAQQPNPSASDCVALAKRTAVEGRINPLGMLQLPSAPTGLVIISE